MRQRRSDSETPPAAAPEAFPAPEAPDAPEAPAAARSYSTLVWRRLRRDRVAMVSAGVLVAIVAICFLGEPIATRVLGHGPNDIFPLASDINKQLLPVGPWSRVPNSHTVITPPHTGTTLFILGGDGPLGRDLFLRVLDGGRTSLELAVGASLIAVLLGGTLGLLSGMFGGWTDAAFSRVTELIMGFPVLLFLVTLGYTVSDRLQRVTLHGSVPDGVVSLVVILGVFYSFYPLRLVRSQVLQLREQEFVEAARSVGASELRIVRQHLLPFIWGSLLIYATQLLAVTIFLEAAFSILNVGISLPTASWGNLIAMNYGSALNAPTTGAGDDAVRTTYLLVFWPSMLLFLTVLSVTLLAEGVRHAIDPQAAAT
jgi:peptide/nickel transport system permease protein